MKRQLGMVGACIGLLAWGGCEGSIEAAVDARGADASATPYDAGREPADAGHEDAAAPGSDAAPAADGGGDGADDAGPPASEGCPSPLPAGWLFCSDFEDADPACWEGAPASRSCDGFAVRGVAELARDEESHSGRAAMRVTFTENEDLGGGYVGFPDQEHVFVRYLDYYAADFDFACGMKVTRLQSFDEAAGLNWYDIINASFGRGSAAGERNFCGVNDHRELAVSYNGGPVDWGRVATTAPIARSRWSCTEIEIRVNTPGRSDGEIRIWIDSSLVAERTEVNIRGSLTAGLDRVLFGGWYSNGCTGVNPCVHPETPAVRYVDDVVVSTTRVGCP